uniref:Uncharacterized protein n=1 Tax=Knipowitschia caucasica TaxID=637954 RepID=A0AAV2K309_KNICA
MMDKTFALRREEVVREAPMIADFKTRWPALFHVREVSSEFKRITTTHLQSKFFAELDAHSAKLLKVYAKKGGVQGRKIKNIMVPITQTADENIGTAMAATVFGIFVMRHGGAEPGDDPEDVGIILEGVEVLKELS